MLEYKRNQVEEAISRTFGEQSARPSSELRTRLKRLLETDRSLGRNSRSADPERANYAFYGSDSPGRGVEVWFSDYEAFALMTGLRLLQHRWPQSFPVAVLRRLRPELEREHARDKRIRENARPGDLYVDNTDPVFLTIVSGQDHPKEGSTGALPCAVCRGMEQVFKFVKQQSAQSYSLNELVTPAYTLLSHLSRVQPRRRGRSS